MEPGRLAYERGNHFASTKGAMVPASGSALTGRRTPGTEPDPASSGGEGEDDIFTWSSWFLVLALELCSRGWLRAASRDSDVALAPRQPAEQETGGRPSCTGRTGRARETRRTAPTGSDLPSSSPIPNKTRSLQPTG